MMSIAFAVPPTDRPPAFGAGLLLQGLRPGVVLERNVPLSPPGQNQALLVPTLSGWWHPGHYIPLQAHLHLTSRSATGAWFIEGSAGLGATWVLNAKKTVRIDGGELRTVPLAGALTASPTVGFALGRPGEHRETLGRVRIAYWVPWQGRFALSWNAEAVVRWGKR